MNKRKNLKHSTYALNNIALNYAAICMLMLSIFSKERTNILQYRRWILQNHTFMTNIYASQLNYHLM